MDWRKCANEEEKIFLQQLIGCMYKAEKQYKCFATSFFVKEWMEDTIRKYLGEVYLQNIDFVGGYDEAERQVALCGDNDEDEVFIQVLDIQVKTGIGKALGHRDFLGALLALGIDRSKIGDIVVNPSGAYVVVVKELAEYIMWHLKEIGRYGKVMIDCISPSEMVLEERQFKEITGTVSSLRADAIFSLAFGLSRTTTAKLLQQEKGKCNGSVVKASDILKVGDIGVLRGYGKMKFAETGGITKKDRMHIKVQKYI